MVFAVGRTMPVSLRTFSFALLALVSGLAPGLRAAVVFTNINGTDCGCGTLVAGSSSITGVHQSQAEAFTPAADYSLSGAEMLLEGGTIGGVVNVSVYSNAAGSVPGSSLDSLGSITVGPADSKVFTADSLSNPLLLQAGLEYWLVLTPGTSSTTVGWIMDGSQNAPASSTSDTTGTSGWTANGPDSLQFQINGDPATPAVPEPATLFLILPALAMLGLARAGAKSALP